MSSGQGDKDLGQRDKGADETATNPGINFADLPFDATIKYMVHNGIEPDYPPRHAIQDPDVVHTAEEDMQKYMDTHKNEEDEGEQGVSSRTRSATNTDRHRVKDDDRFFDHEDEFSYLASLATEHYQSLPPPKETDIIVGFLHRCRRADSVLNVI